MRGLNPLLKSRQIMAAHFKREPTDANRSIGKGSSEQTVRMCTSWIVRLTNIVKIDTIVNQMGYFLAEKEALW